MKLRKQLSEIGVEAGPDTIHTHLTAEHDGNPPCSVSSVWRVLKRRGFIVPEPHKRPKSSYVRFAASLPNECWQMDVTHTTLRNGRVVEVLNVIDDHSRLCVASHAFAVTTAADVVATFHEAATRLGFPASVLSDNGAIFTASFRGDRGALATELARLGITFKHSRPYHPQTCGKVERFEVPPFLRTPSVAVQAARKESECLSRIRRSSGAGLLSWLARSTRTATASIRWRSSLGI